jgi:catechol 2,3-dioxygenase-like lactoylglutathione lyase family enzyme
VQTAYLVGRDDSAGIIFASAITLPDAGRIPSRVFFNDSTNSVHSVQHLMQLEGIDHVAMGVRDIERSAKWYIDVLGFERLHDGMWNGVPTFIGKGNTGIALFPANEEPKTSAHREIRMLHLAFRANRENFLAAQQELKKRGIKFEFQDHEIAHSIYFRDPDGHQLEITTYEVH